MDRSTEYTKHPSVGSNWIFPLVIYKYTRTLGPPKAGHTNRHKTLIILKSNFLKTKKKRIFDFIRNFQYFQKNRMSFGVFGVFGTIN